MPQKDSTNQEFGIRALYNPNPKEREIVRKIYDRYEAMKTAPDRLEALKNWDKWEKQWENWREERKGDEWQSNHVVPLTISVVETALSEIVEQTPRPIILPRGGEDINQAKIMQHIFDYIWEVSDSDLQLFNILKDTLIFGTGIGQEYYWQDRRMIQIDKSTKKGEKKYEEQEIFDYDNSYLEVVKLQDFFPDDKGRTMRGPYGLRDCIRRYIMNIDDFKLMFKGEVWDPLNNTKYVVPGGDTNYYEFYEPPRGIDHSKEVEVLWYWSKKPEDKLIIMANDVLIKDGPNPYKHKQLPFGRCVDIKRTHKFYGKGEAELLESIQDEANIIRRMVIDRNHLDIDKMFFVSNKLSLSDDDLIARPHGAIPVDDVNGAKAVDYADVPRSVELTLKHLEDDGTISTGINPRAQAMPTAGTATEAAILKESTLKRIRMKLWLIKKEFLTDISRLRVSNIIQFYSQPKLEKILGDKRSQRYQTEIMKLKEEGNLTQVGEDYYKKSYRSIPMKGKELYFDAKGKMRESSIRGTSFFEAKPEYFTPFATEGYDIQFEAGSTIQISKPLLQTKMLELYDRVIQVALQVPNSYDPVKLTDMVIETYEKDPNDLKTEEASESDQEQRVQMLIQLATLENKQLINGVAVPATAFASPPHTQIHLQYMNSEEFQKLPNDSPVVENMTRHVVGEIMGIMSRQNGQSGMGGEQTEASSISQGITNRPGGMAQPTNKLEEVLPSLQSGGNKNLP